ncbi:hypothetical protein BDY24DRAFT_380024 [Mrakia frigida]|uniref:uncharacterized protein n=1 Tax=Mrakia frigida TaxID=29902 RepID=UPI003FCC1422
MSSFLPSGSFPSSSKLHRRSRSPSWSLFALPRRIKSTLLTLLAFLLVYLLSSSLLSSSSRRRRRFSTTDPNPFSTPGNLTYDKTNPFETYYRPANGAKSPRLMEKLVKRSRGGEPLVAEAIERARLKRREVERAEGREGDSEEEEEEEDFEWLRGRTILLIGDSLDRYHLLHLCQFLSPLSPLIPLPWPHAKLSDFITIHDLTSRAYPPALRSLEEEIVARDRGGKPFSTPTYRPWTCEIPEFDAMLVWSFMNGLDDGVTTPGVQVYGEEQGEVMVEGERGLVGKEGSWGEKAKESGFGERGYWSVNSEHFNPPLSTEDRLTQLVLPLLANLGRGGAKKIDMVEIGIAAWDLMMFKNHDASSAQTYLSTNPASPPSLTHLSTTLSSLPLSPPRLAWYSTRLSSVLTRLIHLFPPTRSSSSSSNPRVSVRMMVIPPQHYTWPYLQVASRVLQIESEAKRVVQEVNEGWEKETMARWEDGQGEDGMGRKRQGGMRGKGKGPKMMMAGGTAVRWNEWAEVVRSEELPWLDHVHPGPIPASWVWADSTLYELRKLVTGRT